MPTGNWGADTGALQQLGGTIHGQGGDADTAVNGVLTAYTSASGVVKHPKVSGALTEYHTAHKKSHLALPEAVRGLGAGTAGGGVVLAEGENTAASVAKTGAVNAELIGQMNGSTVTS